MIMENYQLPNEILSAFGKRAPMFQVPSAVIMNQIDREGTSYCVLMQAMKCLEISELWPVLCVILENLCVLLEYTIKTLIMHAIIVR